ncbi:MAG: hypothetical protein HY554_05115 [Elusimicrobia bacterium]|nr:hypothetical protein [Elusimicrobiota bacterium]
MIRRSDAQEPEGLRWLLPFLALFFLVYLCNLDSLRFILDDWCQVPRLAALLRGEGRGWREIVDGRWLGNPRIFFLTWLLQASFARVWGLTSAAPYFLFILSAHLLSCALLYRLLRRTALGERAARFAGLAALLTPTSANDLFWINAWFFVLPVTLGLLLAWLYAHPLERPGPDLACLSGLALATQFAGEQTIPVLYAALGLAALRAARRRTEDGGRPLARALVPVCLCAPALAFYYLRCVRPLEPAAFPFDPAAGLGGARDFLLRHFGHFWPWSQALGGGSVAPSAGTWLQAAAAAACVLRLAARDPREDGETARPPLWPVALGAAAAVLLVALPVAYGMARHLRTAVEDRYLYPSGLALCVLAAAGLEALERRSRGAPWRRAAAAAPAALLIALSALMLYDLRDVWGVQRRVDERLWHVIDSQFEPRFRFFITDGLQEAALVPKRSNAVSDFDDDFGVACRLRATHPGASARIVRRYQPEYDLGDAMYLADYRLDVLRARKSESFAIVHRYGKTHADLLASKAQAFSDFQAYQRLRDAEPFAFPPSWKAPGDK